MSTGAGTRGIVLLGLLAVFDGCELGHSCTEMGCGDGAVVTLRRADGTLAAGAYTLRFTVLGQTHVCGSFRMPEDVPTHPGEIKNLDCGSLGVSVLPEVTCMEIRTSDAVGQSCTPIPDHWYFSTVLEGTPPEVAVVVELDGAELLNEQRTLAYQNDYPNGPDCEPVCRRSSAELILPD